MTRDNGAGPARDVDDRTGQTVTFWDMPEVSLVVAWVLTVAVLLLA